MPAKMLTRGRDFSGAKWSAMHVVRAGPIRRTMSDHRLAADQRRPVTFRSPCLDRPLDRQRIMSVDTLDPCGIYFGTTGGQVYASADNGDTWTAIARDLPAVLSIEAQTLP